MDTLLRDIRYAVRSLLKTPGFTIVAVVTLALGIGANTAVFTVVDGLLVAPLPYADGNRIVRLDVVTAGNPDLPLGVASPFSRQWAARSHTLEDFASIDEHAYHVGIDGSRDSVSGAAISPGFMALLKVRPVLGRDFTSVDAFAGAGPVMMLGYDLWQAHYGAARSVLGKVIDVDGVARVVVGVAPKGMSAPEIDGAQPAIWLPLRFDANGGPGRFARLRPGETTASAARALRSILITVPTAADSWTRPCVRWSSVRKTKLTRTRGALSKSFLWRVPRCCSSRAPTLPTCCSCAHGPDSASW